MAPWPAARQPSLSFTIFWSLLKLMSIELVMLLNDLILCHPLLLPSIFSSIRVFSNELAFHIRWPKYWSFSISPSKEYSGLISFRIDWFDLLAAQGILKSLFQFHRAFPGDVQCLNNPRLQSWSLLGLLWWSKAFNAVDMGLIPGWRMKIPHAMEQLSLRAATEA